MLLKYIAYLDVFVSTNMMVYLIFLDNMTKYDLMYFNILEYVKVAYFGTFWRI